MIRDNLCLITDRKIRRAILASDLGGNLSKNFILVNIIRSIVFVRSGYELVCSKERNCRLQKIGCACSSTGQ